MKWWIVLATLLAIAVAVWLARPASRPEPPRLGEYAIEEPPREPGQSARDVTVPAGSLQPKYERTVQPNAPPVEEPSPSARPIHVTPGQLHLRNLGPKSPSERFIKPLPKNPAYLSQ